MVLTREDLCQPAFFRDPYPWYARLRAHEQPYWLPHTMDTSSGGVWLFSRYEDGLKLFKQTTGISKDIRSVRPPGGASPFDLHMLHRDGADHLRLRRLVSEYFSPDAIRQLQPAMAAAADALLAPLARQDRFDLMADFAEPLPLQVIARLLGVPAADMPRIRAWSLVLGDSFDSLISTPAMVQQQKQALQGFLGYIADLTRAKQRDADEGLLSFLVQACREQQLDQDELTAMVGFLLFAGHETTINLIGNGLRTLLAHRPSWEMLREDPGLMPGAVEEILRFESPEQRTSFRVVREPVRVNGTELEPGMQIGVIIGSINRDEAAFEQPDTFDILRSPNRHLAFGIGMHHCLGKTLARIEAATGLAKVLAHLPDLRLVDDEPDWRHNSFFRGLRTLRVKQQGR